MKQLIVIPPQQDFALTPKLWLAIGLMAYNHQLLTLKPLRLITPEMVGPGIRENRREAIARGLAAMCSVEDLNPSARSAFVTIARELLVPLNLNISLHGGAPLEGHGRTPRYALVEDTGDDKGIAMPEEGEQRGPKTQPRSSTSSQPQSA